MNQSLIAVRYAKALFKLAKEKNLVDEIHHDLKLIDSTIGNSYDLKVFLESPIQKKHKKKEILATIFQNSVQSICFNFLNLVIDKQREELLRQIIRDYNDLFRKDNNIKEVTFISASAIDEKFQSSIQSILEDALKSSIELTYKQDESILGGFILTIDGKLMDTSISSKLKNIKKQLLS